MLSHIKDNARIEKRLLDICLASWILLLSLPILCVAVVYIWIKDPGPIFFVQERIGLGGKCFKLYKLRTMNLEKDSHGRLLPDRNRIGPSGALLRKMSLDELPQLLQVILGKMSMVGPRPLLIRYQPYFYEIEKIRFNVLPGITGLAQINGRNTASWDKRLAYDVEYVKKWSFLSDIKILAKTILNVIVSKGVVVDANTIMMDLDIERTTQQKSLK